jgi:hypothetical protein
LPTSLLDSENIGTVSPVDNPVSDMNGSGGKFQLIVKIFLGLILI